MRIVLVTCILLILLCSCHNQENFVIQVFDTPVAKPTADFASNNSLLYEDAEFIASSSCAGEFGGGIQLKDKQSRKIYGYFATCPLALYKIDGRFIAVATVAHGPGFSSIIEIENPLKLSSFRTNVRQDQEYTEPAINDTIFRHGTTLLADTMGLLILSSFMRDGKPYHIMSNFKQTFLATNSRKKFIILKSIANFSTFDISNRATPIVKKSITGHHITFYKNSSAQGYVEVYGDTIRLVRYQMPNNRQQ